jgi:AcrR family transcriptional regulator
VHEPTSQRDSARSTAVEPVPDRAVRLAAAWIEDGRRIDMQQLATELGVSRVTLFRHVGGRDALVGAALWQLTQRTLVVAEQRWERRRAPGELRTVGVLRLFNELVSRAPGLRRLLDEEPPLAIRVLTAARGQVQTGSIAACEALLRRDRAEAGLVLPIEPGALAYALIRIGESFLYADVLAARTPDVETADRLQRALIESGR